MKIYDQPAPAEAFPVGEYLREEIDERGWTVAEFAKIIGRPTQVVSEILNDRKSITEETALAIADATETEAETWLGLQTTYRLWKLKAPRTGELTDVQRRARLARLLPIPELRKRGLLSGSLDDEEAQVRDLLGLSDLSTPPEWSVAARRSDEGQSLSPAQHAWLACVKRTAMSSSVASYSSSRLKQLAEGLSCAVREAEGLRNLPTVFAEAGVILVYVPAFPGSKMDGAAMLVGNNPVIAVSARINTLDGLLFTLLHESVHVTEDHLKSGVAIDDDLNTKARSGLEKVADTVAEKWLLRGEIGIRSKPVSASRVRSEADRLGVHQAIVIGQLKRRELVPWKHFNGMVPKVRPFLSAWPGADYQRAAR